MSPQDRHSNTTVESTRVKKRSTAGTSTASQNGPIQSFFFVDPASSTREKRAHVMRHHIQAKRKQNMLATHADRQSRREPRVYPWMKKSSANSNPNADAFSVRSVVSTPKLASKSQPSTHYKPESRHRTAAQSFHPVETVTTLQKDSFTTVTLDETLPWREEQLLDLWITRLTFWSGQNIHMKTMIFQGAIRHRTTFEAIILGYCARWELHISPDMDSSRVQHYESRVQQAIVGKPGRNEPIFDDEILSLAFAGLALQEGRFGDKNKAREYAEQAKNLQLYKKSSSTDTFGRLFVLYVLGTMEPQQPDIGIEEMAKLVELLRMAGRIAEADAGEDYLTRVPQLSAAFQFESPLFQILSSGPRPTQVPINCRSFVVNKNMSTTDWTRTAALIYIILALCEFRGQKSKVVRFMDHLLQLITDHDLDRDMACESFMWFLLEETFDADLRQPSRAWCTIELLGIYKKLPFELQFRFNEILIRHLMLVCPSTTVDDFERDLQEIMRTQVH